MRKPRYSKLIVCCFMRKWVKDEHLRYWEDYYIDDTVFSQAIHFIFIYFRKSRSEAAVTVSLIELLGWSFGSCNGLILTWRLCIDGVQIANRNTFMHAAVKRQDRCFFRNWCSYFLSPELSKYGWLNVVTYKDKLYK